MTTSKATSPPAVRPAISMSKLAEEKDRAQTTQALRPVVPGVRGLADLHAAITDKHHATADTMAKTLASKGFEGRHLDDMIYEIAQSVCDKIGLPGSKAHDYEYQVANELNTHPMSVQLAVLAVWFDDDVALQEKIEADLMIQL